MVMLVTEEGIGKPVRNSSDICIQPERWRVASEVLARRTRSRAVHLMDRLSVWIRASAPSARSLSMMLLTKESGSPWCNERFPTLTFDRTAVSRLACLKVGFSLSAKLLRGACAIVSVFKLDDLASACKSIPVLGKVMRLEMIARTGNLKTTVVNALQAGAIKLDEAMIVALAKLCRLLGLSGASKTEHLEHIVA